MSEAIIDQLKNSDWQSLYIWVDDDYPGVFDHDWTLRNIINQSYDYFEGKTGEAMRLSIDEVKRDLLVFNDAVKKLKESVEDSTWGYADSRGSVNGNLDVIRNLDKGKLPSWGFFDDLNRWGWGNPTSYYISVNGVQIDLAGSGEGNDSGKRNNVCKDICNQYREVVKRTAESINNIKLDDIKKIPPKGEIRIDGNNDVFGGVSTPHLDSATLPSGNITTPNIPTFTPPQSPTIPDGIIPDDPIQPDIPTHPVPPPPPDPDPFPPNPPGPTPPPSPNPPIPPNPDPIPYTSADSSMNGYSTGSSDGFGSSAGLGAGGTATMVGAGAIGATGVGIGVAKSMRGPGAGLFGGAGSAGTGATSTGNAGIGGKNNMMMGGGQGQGGSEKEKKRKRHGMKYVAPEFEEDTFVHYIKSPGAMAGGRE